MWRSFRKPISSRVVDPVTFNAGMRMIGHCLVQGMRSNIID